MHATGDAEPPSFERGAGSKSLTTGPNLNFDAPDLEPDMSGAATEQSKKLIDFFRHLGLSHTVTPQVRYRVVLGVRDIE
jgi:hypothetical protein